MLINQLVPGSATKHEYTVILPCTFSRQIGANRATYPSSVGTMHKIYIILWALLYTLRAQVEDANSRSFGNVIISLNHLVVKICLIENMNQNEFGS